MHRVVYDSSLWLTPSAFITTEEFFDVAGDVVRHEARLVTLHRNSSSVNQNLLEVPTDVVVVLG